MAEYIMTINKSESLKKYIKTGTYSTDKTNPKNGK